MITLCIREPYYLFGQYRIEKFSNIRQLEFFKATLNKRVQTWILGETPPKPTHSVSEDDCY